MHSFLEQVAQKLYTEHEQGISSLTLLFPSQRARLFFTDALKNIAKDVIWAPEFVTIDELMSEISSLQSADKLRLVAELYKVYSQYHTEEFDHFYHWGEMLIADFDMIDKYRVDAEQLFANIAELKEIDAQIDYLTEEQQNVIRHFWNTLNSGETLSEQKQRFLKVWRSLGSIYTQFKEQLRKVGIGYTGMIYRDAADIIDSCDNISLPYGNIVVAGFNALSSCEKSLMHYLQKHHSAQFFWDYDRYYFDSSMQEAGRFIRENVAEFPSADGVDYDNFRNIKSVNIVSSATSIAQCKYLVEVLKQIAGTDENGDIKPLSKDTAVVLTDENLLLPLLYSLPRGMKSSIKGEKGGVNVTMGYPLRQSVAYTFVEHLIELQHHSRNKDNLTFYYADVEGILSHPYIANIAPVQIAILKKEITEQRIFNIPQQRLLQIAPIAFLFEPTNDAQSLIAYITKTIDIIIERVELSALNREYLIQCHTELQKVLNMLSGCDIEITTRIARSLIRRHLQGLRIPFEGEPIEGLQVMGILETRNIDFKNVILLSLCDSNFPGRHTSDSSFIPYNLRYAYSLPTVEHHQGVYAYYFYRLLQRAENVWLFYPSQADERGSGEPSRYIRQIYYESKLPINHIQVGVEVNIEPQQSFSISKDSNTVAALQAYTSGQKRLSPTAFSTYVQCPMRFYFKYIAAMYINDDLEEKIDNKTFGNIFHLAAELLYAPLIGSNDTALLLKKITDEQILDATQRAIAKEWFDADIPTEDMFHGETKIIRQIVCQYLRENLIRHDIANSNFYVTALEEKYSDNFTFEADGKPLTVEIEGRADRVDSLNNGVIRIIDYKTGSEHLDCSTIESLFEGNNADRESNIINTLLYSMIMHRKTGREVQPALYYLRKMNKASYSPLIKVKRSKDSNFIERYSDIAEEFEEAVRRTLTEIFSEKTDFHQATDNKACLYCDYKILCGR